MRKFGIYLRTQFKRSVRHYPAILAFTLLLAVGIVLILSTLFQSDASEEDRLRVKLGLVGDLSNSYLDLGVMLVQNFDSSQYYLEFVVTDRENAVERLKARELLGFVEVPADFVDAMMYGRDSSVKYVAISGPAVLGSLPVWRETHRRLENSSVMTVLEPLAVGALLIAVTACLVDGSFNPFLYFRF